MIAEALPSHYGSQDNLTESVSRFIEFTAQTVACRGRAYYEIAYFKKTEH